MNEDSSLLVVKNYLLTYKHQFYNCGKPRYREANLSKARNKLAAEANIEPRSFEFSTITARHHRVAKQGSCKMTDETSFISKALKNYHEEIGNCSLLT